jgi:hypothetical protein
VYKNCVFFSSNVLKALDSFFPFSVSNVNLNGKQTKPFEGSSLHHLSVFFANNRQPEYTTVQFIIITDYRTVIQVKGGSLLIRKL